MLVVGIGNALRGDDAAGLLVARSLRDRLPPSWRVMELDGEGTTLLEAWAGEDRAIVVDAVVTGSPTGTIHRFEAHERPLPIDSFRGSSHRFGLAEAVELGRALGLLPKSLIVFGIECGRWEVGSRPSPTVLEAVDRCVDRVLEEIAGLEATA
ncbi:MAG: hydrogenase maturation protease [Fimbriimonadales bacterium]|nr:hydrogenase maturation protease [Fimbriimonadales bacterium]